MVLDLYIGLTGMSLILIAFVMNQIHKWKDISLTYDIVNVIGAGLLVIYSIMIQSYPFLILNSVWTLVSLRDVFLDIKKIKIK